MVAKLMFVALCRDQELKVDTNWDVCLKAILKWEGGNDDDPHDPGGRTSRGIIQREYDAYRQHKGLKVRDVWKATNDEVNDIYKISYWLPHCPNLPDGVDLVYFNMAVNSGPIQGAKILQRVLGVNADGHIGIVTMNAIRLKSVTADTLSLIDKYSEQTRAFYRSLKGFKYYGKGWLNRTNDIDVIAKKLVKS
jgi:lysozyme family protein